MPARAGWHRPAGGRGARLKCATTSFGAEVKRKYFSSESRERRCFVTYAGASPAGVPPRRTTDLLRRRVEEGFALELAAAVEEDERRELLRLVRSVDAKARRQAARARSDARGEGRALDAPRVLVDVDASKLPAPRLELLRERRCAADTLEAASRCSVLGNGWHAHGSHRRAGARLCTARTSPRRT
jgi:hypothetical protein